MTAEYFMLVDPRQGSLAPLGQGERPLGVTAPPAVPQAGPAQRPARNALGVSTSATYNMFQTHVRWRFPHLGPWDFAKGS